MQIAPTVFPIRRNPNGMIHLTDVGNKHALYLSTDDDAAYFIDIDDVDEAGDHAVSMHVTNDLTVKSMMGGVVATIGLRTAPTGDIPMSVWRVTWAEDDVGMGHPGFPDIWTTRGLEPTFKAEVQFFKDFMNHVGLPI